MDGIPTEVEEEGASDQLPTKTPDAKLRLTDKGIEMPEILKGHVGEFKIRTPNITGEYETTDAGLPEDEYYDGAIAALPGGGDYHGDLEGNMMAVSVPREPEAVYEVIDERDG